jgi:hypothetical protein
MTPTAVLPRFRVLAAHARRLDDDALNDLLVDLPKDHYTTLLAQAFPTRRIPPAPSVSLRFRSATADGLLDGGWRELRRWVVLARVPVRAGRRAQRNGSPLLTWGVIGAVAQHQHPQEQPTPTWVACNLTRQPVALDGLCGWPRRGQAAAALAEATSATGARAAALAAFVRGLDDTALNDVLVELPCAQFDALCEAAFPADDLEEVA